MGEAGNAAGVARALAARRKRVTRRCEICGTEFTGVTTRRYCSAACRLRASRQRRGHLVDGSRNMSRKQSTRAQGALTPEIVERIARRREANADAWRGRVFDDSGELLHQLRDERTFQLLGEPYPEALAAVERLNRQREINDSHGWAQGPDSTDVLRQVRDGR